MASSSLISCDERWPNSIHPQLRNMPRIGLKFTLLDALDDIDQDGVGAARDTNLLALADHEPVEKFDFGAPPLLHVLAHRRALLGGGVLTVLETLLVAGPHRRLVALACSRDGFRRQVQNVFQRIAVRLTDPDRLGAKAGGKVANGIALEQVAAAKPCASGQSVLH